jgi:hypothetical protein
LAKEGHSEGLITRRGKEMAEMQSGREEIHTPGTLALVFIFLVWFVSFYFLAWWFLSQLWPVR